MCAQIPFCLGTDCKSLYDTTMKPASSTKKKRVALDLLDVREGVEHLGDQIRWVPTDHMLVDSLTKAMKSLISDKDFSTCHACIKTLGEMVDQNLAQLICEELSKKPLIDIIF